MTDQMELGLARKIKNLGEPVMWNSKNEMEALIRMASDNRVAVTNEGLYTLTPVGGKWLHDLGG